MQKKAVLLDVDGTLIDSNDAHARAWVDAGREFGYDIHFDHVRWLVGMGGDKVLPEVTGLDEASEEGKKILDRRGKIFRQKYVPSLQPFEKARELLVRLRDDGYKLVAATSASEDDLQALLKQAQIDDVIERVTTSDDADESKPAPDIVEAALNKAKVSAAEAIMLGDTPYDVGAATRADVEIIAFRCGGWSDEELHGAIAVYDNPGELLSRYSESIFGKKSEVGT